MIDAHGWRYAVVGLRCTLWYIISIQLVLNTTPTSTNVRPDIEAHLFNLYIFYNQVACLHTFWPKRWIL